MLSKIPRLPTVCAMVCAIRSPIRFEHYVQVGAFALRRNADKAVARLQSAGVAGAFIFGPPATRSHLYRVRIGPVSGVPEFDKLVARLTALGYPGARLVGP
jgi:cell division protein FtsN